MAESGRSRDRGPRTYNHYGDTIAVASNTFKFPIYNGLSTNKVHNTLLAIIIRGNGLTKEVAVGTVIEDPSQINYGGQPRWDRFERADLFEQYRELRRQSVSERQVAKKLKVPRTTLQAWRMWHETLDI